MSDSDTTTSTAFAELLTGALPPEQHELVPGIMIIFSATDEAYGPDAVTAPDADSDGRYLDNDEYNLLDEALTKLFETEGLPQKMAQVRGLASGKVYAYTDDGWLRIVDAEDGNSPEGDIAEPAV